MKAATPWPLLDRFLSAAGPADAEAYAGLILRDVEELLNSRLSSPLGEAAEESEAGYGLADLSLGGRGEGDLLKLARAVRRCLELYEPRLERVRVEARPPSPAEIDTLTVRIEAGLAGADCRHDLALDVPVRVRRE
ncbi:MAG: type VI secretion system baseplate subunit TssE [Candidatus Adiutrix sp.]|jgi:type VI secretion system lysozyme-like protein|nr:type VI secretion system baseplate subunit TssE [Candidatus Adiutrix sp.]